MSSFSFLRFFRERNFCSYCGVSLYIKQTQDHIVPRARQGEITIVSCVACNSAKADLSLDEFLGTPWFRERLKRHGYSRNLPRDLLKMIERHALQKGHAR